MVLEEKRKITVVTRPKVDFTILKPGGQLQEYIPLQADLVNGWLQLLDPLVKPCVQVFQQAIISFDFWRSQPSFQVSKSETEITSVAYYKSSRRLLASKQKTLQD